MKRAINDKIVSFTLGMEADLGSCSDFTSVIRMLPTDVKKIEPGFR